ncbi:MAG: N-acylglucosamine 2-epimerase [Flavobacteriaceae bacterium]|nr:N-acylglucosamine 2-epimerase [Flavobacteriaceae bacterium]
MSHPSFSALYLRELTQEVIPFWEKYSLDEEYGGYFTCIDGDHKVYDTDKFVWLQARQVWTFATLYDRHEKKESWLKIAQYGSDFLEKFGHDGDFNWYFSLQREGKPLTMPYNIFSHIFACMAMGKMYQITGNEKYKIAVEQTLIKITERAEKPKDRWDKSFPNTRPMKNFALPMILCNLYNELGDLVETEEKKVRTQDCVNEIFDLFWDEKRGIILENISLSSIISDCFEARLVNPGHGLEAMWFIMDLGQQYDRKDWIDSAVAMALSIVDKGWDKKQEGIFYFMDAEGHPPQQLEWDQKLWWVHLEAMICFLRGYELTGSKECWNWFEKVHYYTWKNFRDLNRGGEWYGYLNRSGNVHLNLKGGKWKGCFHVPRALYNLHKIAERSMI